MKNEICEAVSYHFNNIMHRRIIKLPDSATDSRQYIWNGVVIYSTMFRVCKDRSGKASWETSP